MKERPSRFKSPEAQSRYFQVYDSVLAQWPVPYEERYIETELGRTHVIECGPADAPPLILLHGFHGTALMWITHIAELSRQFRCHLVETVGDAGKSLSYRPARNADDYVNWLAKVYGGLGLTRARVMGLSHGGWLAANLALRKPALVERLIPARSDHRLDAPAPLLLGMVPPRQEKPGPSRNRSLRLRHAELCSLERVCTASRLYR